MRILTEQGRDVETITQADLLEALRQALETKGAEDAITTTEMVDMVVAEKGWTRPYAERRVRAVIGELRKAGKLELVENVRRPSAVDDRLCRVKGFRLAS